MEESKNHNHTRCVICKNIIGGNMYFVQGHTKYSGPLCGDCYHKNAAALMHKLDERMTNKQRRAAIRAKFANVDGGAER